ncbi:DUF3341 domain-containing protein [Marinicauda algicola]|uniref:DUF3341 domain-containing protein n=2 Tax=Marinicauda algicola TaxID=2029849 RepID=UPI001A7EE017|nr:DUF3341 domain-containing protein [Marinicauda algicola]
MSERPHALLAEMKSPEALREGVMRLQEAGFTRIEAYSPIPVDGLGALLDIERRPLDRAALFGALFGLALGFAITVGQSVFQYPINVGGRPLFSWPAFMIPAFELGVLFGALGALIGFFRASGLPRLNSPLFEVERFEKASEDAYFLAVFADDPRFGDAREALEDLDPAAIREAQS